VSSLGKIKHHVRMLAATVSRATSRADGSDLETLDKILEGIQTDAGYIREMIANRRAAGLPTMRRTPCN